jgi:hypothetical protein
MTIVVAKKKPPLNVAPARGKDLSRSASASAALKAAAAKHKSRPQRSGVKA